MKFYIETFGCTANFGNSQDVAEALQEMGHMPSPLEEADLVIVNTCAVTEKTERRILRRLRSLQGERLVIAGCLQVALPESVSRICCRKRLGLLNRSTAAEIAGHHPIAGRANSISPSPRQDLCGIINISEGCTGVCSYCIVRKARGGLVSRPPEDVLEAARKLGRSGCVEIQLAAQDTAAYGMDIGTCLPELLEMMENVPGNFMVRVGMMNPDTARLHLAGLIEALRSPRVFKFLHIPLQSGSDRVLKNMGRRYSSGDFLDIVKDLRSSCPDLSINTDVIVGFPGETDGDFQQTLDLIKHAQPDKVNVTRFSRRPGTAAARLYDMPDRIKKERSRALTRLWLEIAAQRNLRYVGEDLAALVTERGRGYTMKARAANYQGIVVEGDVPLGAYIKVKITGSNPFYISGRVQDERQLF
ncbi:MAG: tRNA (N(6)-L-threonylcarbamoyladenosine(37)-C(2))-methylthiotransferase [Methanothrix sp.]|nr:tRNA (N(6)-L-threonylcarbamoyladenosine(37)-C(2))-methylthiotransferase [Methanothrix sp.]